MFKGNTTEKNLLQKKKELESKLASLGGNFDESKLLKAIEKQNFYFFKNKPNVVFDKASGLLWPNMDTFPYLNNGSPYEYDWCYNESREIVNIFFRYEKRGEEKYVLEGFSGWRYPQIHEIIKFYKNLDNPFSNYGKNSGEQNNVKSNPMDIMGSLVPLGIFNSSYTEKHFQPGLKGCESFFVNDGSTDIDLGTEKIYSCGYAAFLPCLSVLTDNTKYAVLTVDSNNILTPEEKSRLILEFFLEYDFIPAFEDHSANDLFAHYTHKDSVNELKLELEKVDKELAGIQKSATPVGVVDYKKLLKKYDLVEIDDSLIQYCGAVQQWTEDLLKALESYERQNMSLINNFNNLGINLSKRYVNNSALNIKENKLLEARQKFFKERFTLGISNAKKKILAVRVQARTLTESISEAEESDDILFGLGKIEQQKPVSFAFLAENTAKIVNNAIKTTEYFRVHGDFIKMAIAAWEEWNKDYLYLKNVNFAQLHNSAREDGIEEEICNGWCEEWSTLRYQVEKKLQPLVERGLRGEIKALKNPAMPVIQQLLKLVSDYKESIDMVFLEERKGVYQRFAFQSGGELQEKFEMEILLYQCTVMLQDDLQEVIFNCAETEDRVFILNWASDLLNIQIDDLLQYISDQRLDKISNKVLGDFAQLRLQNLDNYLNDARAYAQEKNRREKEFNSLMFKMRKSVDK